MRIVHFIDTLSYGGCERQLVELLKGLVAVPGIKCELIVMSEIVHYDALYTLKIPVHLLLRKTKKDPSIFVRLYQLLRKIQPDILHSWSSMCSVYALPAVKLMHIKFVNGFLRNAPPSFSFKDEEWLRSKITFPFSDAIVANSKAGLNAYNTPKKKSHFIYNGFDLNRVAHLADSEAVKEKYQITTKLVVGMVASFSDNKDFKTFVDAARHILKARKDVTFLAIGDAKHRDAKKNWDSCVESVPEELKNLIKFPGKISDIESLVQVMTIGVLISNAKVHGEGISNSIMEYMALGKPVVATECGGNKELVIDGKTGYLVPNGDVAAVVDKIHFLLDNPQQARHFGKAGQQRLQDMFSLKKLTQNHIALYNQLLA